MKPSKQQHPKPLHTFDAQQPLFVDAKMAQNEEWYTIESLMLHLNVSRSSVYRMRNANLLPCYKLGRTVVFPKSLINKMMLLKSLQDMNDASKRS